MHVSKEFLMEAVGLSLLVALILISMQMFRRAVQLSSLLEENQEQQIAELEEYEIVRYDGLLIDGMTAVGYIKRMVGGYDLTVHVTTEEGKCVISDRSEYPELRNVESEKYINPMAKYRCEVIRDENESIREIKLEIEMEEE